MEHKPLTIECNVPGVNLRAVSYDCTVFIAIELWKQDWRVSECSHLHTKAGEIISVLFLAGVCIPIVRTLQRYIPVP